MSSRYSAIALAALCQGCFGQPGITEVRLPSVCPDRPGHALQRIELFDGSPDERALLAPNDPETAPDTYLVGDVYERGRHLTARCLYDPPATVDVVLDEVSRCEASEGPGGVPRLTCG